MMVGLRDYRMSNQSDWIDIITNYLHDNYYEDCEHMAKIKMITFLATQGWGEHDISSLIDKIALFNNIKKSYPPKKTFAKKVIESIGFIMYGA